MPVIDYAKMQEFPMRAGITGKWIAGHEHGSTSTSVLSNTVESGVGVPRHLHEYEEIVLVEAGEIWVELDKVRQTATPASASSFRRTRPMPGEPRGRARRACFSSGRCWSRSRRARAPTSTARLPR